MAVPTHGSRRQERPNPHKAEDRSGVMKMVTPHSIWNPDPVSHSCPRTACGGFSESSDFNCRTSDDYDLPDPQEEYDTVFPGALQVQSLF